MIVTAETYHVPVLLKESVDGLDIQPDGVYVDVTLAATLGRYCPAWERKAIFTVSTKMPMRRKISWPMIDLPLFAATLGISASGCATIMSKALTDFWPT